jgi:hypothetical protein
LSASLNDDEKEKKIYAKRIKHKRNLDRILHTTEGYANATNVTHKRPRCPDNQGPQQNVRQALEGICHVVALTNRKRAE